VSKKLFENSILKPAIGSGIKVLFPTEKKKIPRGFTFLGENVPFSVIMHHIDAFAKL
jgi:hypothetical protein